MPTTAFARRAPSRPVRDQPDRDAFATELLHCGDRNGREWADVIDLLTMHPDARRRVVRLLGELEAI
jgi:hypothetical protein